MASDDSEPVTCFTETQKKAITGVFQDFLEKALRSGGTEKDGLSGSSSSIGESDLTGEQGGRKGRKTRQVGFMMGVAGSRARAKKYIIFKASIKLERGTRRAGSTREEVAADDSMWTRAQIKGWGHSRWLMGQRAHQP